MNKIQQIILDEGNNLDSNKLKQRELKRAAADKQNKMLNSDDFRITVQQFKQRLQDQKAPEKYNLNQTTRNLRNSTENDFIQRNLKDKESQKNLQLSKKMHSTESKGVSYENQGSTVKLGVKRTDNDLKQMLYGTTQNNDKLFKEPISRDGKIQIFNKAAGHEHQAGKDGKALIFDKKAVL